MGPVKMDQYTYERRYEEAKKFIAKQQAVITALEQASGDMLQSLHNVGECPCVRCKQDRINPDGTERKWPGSSTEIKRGDGVVIATKEEDSSVEFVPVEQDLQWEDDFRTQQLMARVDNQVDLLDYKDKLIASLRHKWKCTFYLLLAWIALSMFYIVPVFI